VHELGTRVARSVEICKNRKLFSNDDLWKKRTRACVETTALLVCCANAKLAWFGGISKLLGDIGGPERIRELSMAGTDELFVMRWTCISLVAIRPILEDNRYVQLCARRTILGFARANETGNNDVTVLEAVQKIDETLQKARGCLETLYDALYRTEDLTEEVTEILHGYESEISELEQINIEADRLDWVDAGISSVQFVINRNSHHIPGTEVTNWESIPFGRFVELSRDPRKLQFIRPGQTLKSMCSPSLTLRSILEGQGDADAYKELLKNLYYLRYIPDRQIYEMQRQLWRLQDFSDGGGLGFTVELFFIVFWQFLSTSSSKESNSALYTGTFRAITSDWSKYKHSLGTQKLILDIAMSRQWEFNDWYPVYIVDEFLLLLGNIFEGQMGPHIDRARQHFESSDMYDPRGFWQRVLRVLTPGQAQSLAS
jgi:hypothetical protein